jgi:hypothetical protein
MGGHLQLNDEPLSQAIPHFQLSPVTLGQSRRRYTPATSRLWPEHLHLSINPNLEILICDQIMERPGYDLLSPAIKAVLLNLAAREAGSSRPPWLPAEPPASDEEDSRHAAAEGDAADRPPFLYGQFQFMPAGTAPQATLHLSNRGHPSVNANWDSAAGALAGQLILTFHKENQSGWELSLSAQGNMNLSTNPALTGVQGAGAATYILQIADGLQFQTVIQGAVSHDFGGSTSAGLSVGGVLQYDLTDRLHLTAGLTAGVSNRWTGVGPQETNSIGIDNTFAIGFVVDTDKIRRRR